jgi:putative sterol carrier protein
MRASHQVHFAGEPRRADVGGNPYEECIMTYQFLSDEWMTAAKSIREKYADQAAKVTSSIRMNQVITDVPFGEGTVRVFLDTSSGAVDMELGELDTPDLTVTTDWETARKIFVDGDQAAGMQAFMSGKIKVQGDMMKMMAMQTSMPQDDIAKQIASEIQSITA